MVKNTNKPTSTDEVSLYTETQSLDKRFIYINQERGSQGNFFALNPFREDGQEDTLFISMKVFIFTKHVSYLYRLYRLYYLTVPVVCHFY